MVNQDAQPRIMASSISKAQADALAAGFFDKIGDTKDGLQPEETLSALYQLAGGLVSEAQDNLNQADRVASGALSDSIKVLNPEYVNRSVRIDIEALFYYKFVDKGVKGTKKGSGQYSFKNAFVGKSMVNAIRKWVIREGLKARTNVGGPSITKREAKRKTITDSSYTTAFVIAKSIKQKGLKRTNFFAKAITSTRDKTDEALGKAFKVDIINSLPKKLS